MSYYRNFSYNSRPRYRSYARSSNEARFMNSRFSSKCSGCGMDIAAGDPIVKPRSLDKWFCRSCGLKYDSFPEAYTPATPAPKAPAENLKLENPVLAEGRYAVVDADGTYRAYRVARVKSGNCEGFYKVGMREAGATRWTWFAFSKADGGVKLWMRRVSYLGDAKLNAMVADVAKIVTDPAAAGLAYAVRENECFRCGKKLVVPASVYAGMGATCAKKSGWRKADNDAALAAGIVGGGETRKSPVAVEADVDPEADEVDAEFEEAWAERNDELEKVFSN